MEIMPWKPMQGLTSLRRDMDNLCNQFINNVPSFRQLEKEWNPPVDVTETNFNLK